MPYGSPDHDRALRGQKLGLEVLLLICLVLPACHLGLVDVIELEGALVDKDSPPPVAESVLLVPLRIGKSFGGSSITEEGFDASDTSFEAKLMDST